MRAMHAKRSRLRSVAFVLVSSLLCILTASTGCGQDPVIVVDVATWPAGVERIRVLPSVNGTVNADILIDPSQSRFAVRVPAGTAGTVQLDAVGLDGMGCKRAVGSLTEPVPENFNHFVERTLELQPLPASVCGQDPVNLPVILVDIAARPAGVERIRVRWTFNGIANPDILLDLSQSQFPIHLPAGSVGSLHFDAVGLDAMYCKLAVGSLTVSVPDSCNHCVEPTLALSLLPAPVCVVFAPATNFQVGVNPTAVAVGDFNSDNKPDLAVADYGSTTVSVLLSNGSDSYGTATDFPAGNTPYSVAVGDFNGDKKNDLAVAGYGNSNGLVLLGNGSGGFGATTTFPTDTSAVSVAIADFNGDQKLDLAIANDTSASVSMLLGNGSGGFGAATNFPVGTLPESMVVGDFNSDNKPDLAIANYSSNNVSVLLGNGLGFGAATNFSVGTSPYSVAVGDFNGDSKLDLAVANFGSNNVSVRLGNGSGGFGAATNFTVGMAPRSVTVGDFNGDNKPDLAVANSGSTTVSVLLGNGSGVFGVATNFPVGSNPNWVVAGDFNGDKMLDLAVANASSNTVSVLLNQF